MYHLAFDANGRPITLPPTAVRFLVRKHRPKTAPQVLWRNGQPVSLPLDASFDDLLQAVQHAPGRYRLLPVDDHNQTVADVDEAYAEIDPPEPPAAAFTAPAPQPEPHAITRSALTESPTELLLFETMRAHTELSRAVIDQFAGMMNASANLLRAADGAGLPRRAPVWFDDDDAADDDDDEPEPPRPSFFETFFQTALANGNLGGFAKLLGAGAGTSTAPAAPSFTAPAAPPARNAAPPPATASTAPPATPAASGNAERPDPQRHLLAILAQLTADERAYAERVFTSLSPAAVQQWHELLLSMSVDEAVRMIRAKATGQET